jgi:hypothetical protein
MEWFRRLVFHRRRAHNSPHRRLSRGDCALNRCQLMQACITSYQYSATARFAFDCARALQCCVRGWVPRTTTMIELLIAVLGLSSVGIFAAHTIDALWG